MRERPRSAPGRPIGPIGTGARAGLGAAFLVLAVLTGEFQLYSLPLGLVGFPAVLVVVQAAWARRAPGRIRATGHLGFCLNFLLAIPLFVVAETRAAAFLFYGASMLLAAARGDAGCEVVAVPNWLLGRRDEIGCVVFSPIDAAEAAARDGSTTR